MKTEVLVLSLVLGSASAGLSSAGDGGGEDAVSESVLASREWQELLDRAEFAFDSEKASIITAVSRYDGDCTICMTYDWKQTWPFEIEFLRKGEPILTLKAHGGTVFDARGDVLYVAAFGPMSPGGWVFAYSLTDGSELWRTRMKAIGVVEHSTYSNPCPRAPTQRSTPCVEETNQSGVTCHVTWPPLWEDTCSSSLPSITLQTMRPTLWNATRLPSGLKSRWTHFGL